MRSGRTGERRGYMTQQRRGSSAMALASRRAAAVAASVWGSPTLARSPAATRLVRLHASQRELRDLPKVTTHQESQHWVSMRLTRGGYRRLNPQLSAHTQRRHFDARPVPQIGTRQVDVAALGSASLMAHNTRSAHPAPRFQRPRRQLGRGQPIAVVAVHLAEASAAHPLRTGLCDILLRPPHEVPPHHDLFLERLAAEEQQAAVGVGAQGQFAAAAAEVEEGAGGQPDAVDLALAGDGQGRVLEVGVDRQAGVRVER